MYSRTILVNFKFVVEIPLPAERLACMDRDDSMAAVLLDLDAAIR